MTVNDVSAAMARTTQIEQLLASSLTAFLPAEIRASAQAAPASSTSTSFASMLASSSPASAQPAATTSLAAYAPPTTVLAAPATTALTTAQPASALTYPASALPALASTAGDPCAAVYPAATTLSATDPGATAVPVASAAPAGASSGESAYLPLIQQAAARYGIDPALLYGVVRQESAFDPNAVSSAGAEGLAQIMPSNFASLGITNPFDPAQSVDGGARMLAENLQTFGGNTTNALAAYNAGVGAVERSGGVPPYAETQNYVSQVLAYAGQYPGTTAAATATAAPSTVATILGASA